MNWLSDVSNMILGPATQEPGALPAKHEQADKDNNAITVIATGASRYERTIQRHITYIWQAHQRLLAQYTANGHGLDLPLLRLLLTLGPWLWFAVMEALLMRTQSAWLPAQRRNWSSSSTSTWVALTVGMVCWMRCDGDF